MELDAICNEPFNLSFNICVCLSHVYSKLCSNASASVNIVNWLLVNWEGLLLCTIIIYNECGYNLLCLSCTH